MNITLPEPLESTLTPSQAALHLAIGLFTAWEVTLGQAAEAAGISQSEFMRELGRRKIPLHYGVEDFAEDLITIENSAPASASALRGPNALASQRNAPTPPF